MQRIEDDFEDIVQLCLNSVAHGTSTALGLHCVHYDGLGRRMNLVNESIGIRTRLSTGHPGPLAPPRGNGMDEAQGRDDSFTAITATTAPRWLRWLRGWASRY